MKKITVTMDRKNRTMTLDYDGFPGDTCYKEALRFAAIAKALGVEVEVRQVQPKRDSTVVSSEIQTVREG